LPFKGGESAGLARLEEYLFETGSLATYKETRNGLLGANYSSKLSPWLANGSLSIRKVYHETRRFENEYERNDSTKHFIDELFWRDFFHFWCRHHGMKIFSSYGIYDRSHYRWQTDLEIIKRWRDGTTGMPIIDAFMRELNATGFMGNRGRQIVASYFSLDLRQDWRYGAHYFEEKLIDHDVQSNYGGWNAGSGIGPGKVLMFNTMTQSTKFDTYGDYIRTWVPELANVPLSHIHDPWNMPAPMQKKCGV